MIFNNKGDAETIHSAVKYYLMMKETVEQKCL